MLSTVFLITTSNFSNVDVVIFYAAAPDKYNNAHHSKK